MTADEDERSPPDAFAALGDESWNLPAQRTAVLTVESTAPPTVTSRIELEGDTLEAFAESDLTTSVRVLEGSRDEAEGRNPLDCETSDA